LHLNTFKKGQDFWRKVVLGLRKDERYVTAGSRKEMLEEEQAFLEDRIAPEKSRISIKRITAVGHFSNRVSEV